MSLSILLEKNLKAQIVAILAGGTPKTADHLFFALRKKGISCTKRGIFKLLSELLKQKVLIKYGATYEMNPDWVSQLGNDAEKSLRKLLENNLLGIHVKDLKQGCSCNNGVVEGFCGVCYEMACKHCGFKQLKHVNCSASCFNCKCGKQEDFCRECDKKACLSCAKELWLHEHQFCKKKGKTNIAIMEVDHDCWFSNTSEKYPEEIMLNNFSDVKDRGLGTHSGMIKVKGDNKLVERIMKQDTIRQAKIVHKTGKTFYVKTRADINKSVDQFTQKNKSVLLNPIIAVDTKEQNLVLSPSKKEMRKMRKGLQEFGGKVRLVSMESFDVNHISQIKNKRIREFLEKVPKKELLDELQKVKLRELV